MRARIVVLGFAVLVTMVTMVTAVAPAEAQSEPLTWWALGDSYSSGEGIPGTESPATGAAECARASGNNTNAKAWAVVARETLAEPRISSWAFTPCTGAVSSDVAGQMTEAAAKSGKEQADIVTLSMGGNDILFADVIEGCLDVAVSWQSLIPGCDVSEAVVRRRIDMLVGRTQPEKGQYTGITLPNLYDLIASKVRPGGAVVVLGYPQLVEETARWDGWRRNLVVQCESVQMFDIAMLRSVAGYLNEQIALAVQAADKRWETRGVRFHWRDIATGVYETGDESNQRHALCSVDPWINGLTVGVTSGDLRYKRSFHPKQIGHSTTGTWLGNWMRTDVDIKKMGQKPAPKFDLQGVGAVRLNQDSATAVKVGRLQMDTHDLCPAEIDGGTSDDLYSMPAPTGTQIDVVIDDGHVFSYSASGRWTTSFGVSNGENVYEVADRFRSKGWTVTVSGEDDIFSAGRLEATRGNDMFTIESDDSSRTERLSVPRPIYCD